MKTMRKKYPFFLFCGSSKRYKEFIKQEKGFTLLELILAAALLSLVMLAAFSLYFLSDGAFARGTARCDLQQNVRLSADLINREVRHAVSLVLLSEEAISYNKPGDINNYIIRRENSEIILVINNANTKVAYDIDRLLFYLEGNLLHILILGDDGEQAYRIETAVRLKNLL